MTTQNILVTGCDGDIGLSLGRILKTSNICKSVIGCDIHDNHLGSLTFDKCDILPRVDSPKYFSDLKKVLRKYSVDLVIPASEPELRHFFKKNFFNYIGKIPVLTANKKALTIGLDKLKTAEFLKSIKLPYPWTKIVGKSIPLNYPCLIKSRYGAGSKNINMVDSNFFSYYQKKRPDDIWQEYLTPEDEEYTCGIYRTKSKEIRTIIFKRKLQGGHTVSGITVENKKITGVLSKLAQSLNLRGSINAQLRLTKKGPVIFEINPRFSSTVVFRHLLGFQDLIWSIKEKFGQKLEPYKEPRAGIKFYRGSKEYIFFPDGKFII